MTTCKGTFKTRCKTGDCGKLGFYQPTGNLATFTLAGAPPKLLLHWEHGLGRSSRGHDRGSRLGGEKGRGRLLPTLRSQGPTAQEGQVQGLGGAGLDLAVLWFIGAYVLLVCAGYARTNKQSANAKPRWTILKRCNLEVRGGNFGCSPQDPMPLVPTDGR